MKEIHDTKFRFVPSLCKGLLQEVLLAPVPRHMVRDVSGDGDNNAGGKNAAEPAPKPKPTALVGDLTKLPPLSPTSWVTRRGHTS